MGRATGPAPAVIADVGVYPVADLLAWIHARRGSGFLRFQRADLEERLFLDKGQVISAASNQACDRIGPLRVRTARLSLAQLRDAELHPQPPHRFGKALVERTE